MVLRARDVMTGRVVSVQPETPTGRARYLLTENRFSALPVVDGRYRLVGIVTTFDLLRADASSATRRATTVADVMTRDPMTMSPDATVPIIAHRLRNYGELRVMPIVESGRLAGVVTRGDLLAPEPAGGVVGRWGRRFGRSTVRPPTMWGDVEVRSGPSAADVMTPSDQVYDLTEEMPVTNAAALLREHRFTAMPVTDEDGHVVGILSEADLVPDRLSGRRTPPPRTVGEAMTRDVVHVREANSVGELAQSMVARGLRLVPVVDAHARLVGVVSRGDLLRAMAERDG